MMKLVFAALGLSLIAAVSFYAGYSGVQRASAEANEEPLVIKMGKQVEGEPWNGGKLQPPVRIESDIQGVVDGNTDIELNVGVLPLKNCTDLRTEIRGIDGVLVSGETIRVHDRCEGGKRNLHQVTARVADGLAGFVVVDVSMTIDGVRYGTSKPIAFQTRSGKFNRNELPMGKLIRDPKGKAVILMQSE